jgi:hypothetical protein
VANEIIGCTRCGWVSRPDLFEDEAPACHQCGGALQQMGLSYARRLVSARRRADKRRSDAAKAAEVGLHGAEPGTP